MRAICFHISLLTLPLFLPQMVERLAVRALRIFRACMDESLWSCDHLEDLSRVLMSSSPSPVHEALDEICTLVSYSHFCCNDMMGLKRVQQLLVALLGHKSERIRYLATVLLNAFFDGHDWQRDAPFVSVIKQVGEKFEVELSVQDEGDLDGAFLILSAPSFNPGSRYKCYSYHTVEWRHNDEETRQLFVKFQNFSRCGFYDWRVVRINEACGSWEVSRLCLVAVEVETQSQ